MSTDHDDRGVAALEHAQRPPCGLCAGEPRLAGDHLGPLCRKRLNDARYEYEQAVKKIEEEGDKDADR